MLSSWLWPPRLSPSDRGPLGLCRLNPGLSGLPLAQRTSLPPGSTRWTQKLS